MDNYRSDSPAPDSDPERPETIRQPAPTHWPGMSDAARARLAEAKPPPAPAPAPAPQPWDEEAGAPDSDTPDAPDYPGQRHDALTAARKAKFLRALMKCGCITEACRRAKVAPRTVYNHQQQDGTFLAHCATARRMAATPVEITAWSRAIDGVEETVVVGGRAVTRTRHSEALLRMMLQASNPKKFGRNPGFTAKRMRAAERKELKRELRRELYPKLRSEAYEKARAIARKVFHERRERFGQAILANLREIPGFEAAMEATATTDADILPAPDPDPA